MAGSCVPAAKNWRWSWKRRATTGLSATNCSPPEQDMQTTTSIQAPKPTRDADPYLAAFERFENEAKHPSWLFPLRKAGLARFAELGFPTLRHEDWRFTNVAPIAKLPFKPIFQASSEGLTAEAVSPFTFGGLAANRLVFVNGHYIAGLSSP